MDLELEWNQRHPTCNYFKSFSRFLRASSASTNNLMKEIRFGAGWRTHAATTVSHEENAPVVAVAAWSFVVVTSVTVARPLQKPAEFKAS